MIPKEHAPEIADVLYSICEIEQSKIEAYATVITAIRELCGMTEAAAKRVFNKVHPNWMSELED